MISEKIFEHEDEDGDTIGVRAVLSRLDGKPIIILDSNPSDPGDPVCVRLFPAEVRGLLEALAGWLAKHDTPPLSLGFREKFVQDEVIVSVPENEADIRLEALRLAVLYQGDAKYAVETAREFEAYLRGTQ